MFKTLIRALGLFYLVLLVVRCANNGFGPLQALTFRQSQGGEAIMSNPPRKKRPSQSLEAQRWLATYVGRAPQARPWWFVRVVQAYPMHFVVGVTALLVAVVVCWLNLEAGTLTANRDAMARLQLAYRVLTNISGETKAVMTGGTWPPIPQWQMLLPIWLAPASYRTGLAGTWSSIVPFVIATVALYETACVLARTYFGGGVERYAGITAVIVFLGTPDNSYFGVISMSEMPLIAGWAVALLGLLKWYLKPEGSTWWLAVTGWSLLYAAGSRYEGWYLGAMATAIVIARSWLLKRSLSEIVSASIIVATPWFVEFVVWHVFQTIIFHNPVFYSQSQYSASSIEMEQAHRTYLRFDLLELARQYTIAVRMNFAPLNLIVAGGGIVTYTVAAVKQRRLLLPAVFAFAVPAAVVLSLFLGQSAIEMRPEDNYFYNLRYGLMVNIPVALSVAFLVACLAKGNLWLGRAAVVVVLCIALFQMRNPVGNTAMARDVSNMPNPDQTAYSQWVRTNYRPGTLMMGETFLNPAMYEAQIRHECLVTESDHPWWEQSLANPTLVDWILVRHGDTLDDLVVKRPDFQANFQLVFDNPYGAVYQYKNGGALEGRCRHPNAGLVPR